MKTFKVETEIQIPEGYKPAPGKQPRSPKPNEPFLNSLGFVQKCDFQISGEFYVLQKSQTEYLKIEDRLITTSDGLFQGDFIQVQAVKDALEIIEYALDCYTMPEHLETIDALRGVVK